MRGEEAPPEASSMEDLLEDDPDRSLEGRFSVVPRGVVSWSRLSSSSGQCRERDSSEGVGPRALRDESSLERDDVSLRLAQGRVCVGELGGSEAVNARRSASESLDDLRLELPIDLGPLFPRIRLKGSVDQGKLDDRVGALPLCLLPFSRLGFDETGLLNTPGSVAELLGAACRDWPDRPCPGVRSDDDGLLGSSEVVFLGSEGLSLGLESAPDGGSGLDSSYTKTNGLTTARPAPLQVV